jgi:hypothetical protein
MNLIIISILILVGILIIILGYFLFFIFSVKDIKIKSPDNIITNTKLINNISVPDNIISTTKLVNNISDPDGIKNGKYQAIPINNFFSSNNDNWSISIKFNLEKFNNTRQSMLGNTQGIGWGLWITPLRKLEWKIGAKSWELDNLGVLKDNTLYQIDLTYNNGNYIFLLKNLDDNKIFEKFTVNIDPMVITAEPIITNNGVVTIGGETNYKFLGTISDVISFQITSSN